MSSPVVDHLLEELEEQRPAMTERDRQTLTDLQAVYDKEGDLYDDHNQSMQDLLNDYL